MKIKALIIFLVLLSPGLSELTQKKKGFEDYVNEFYNSLKTKKLNQRRLNSEVVDFELR